MARRWHLARTGLRGEYAASDQLRSLGVEVFFPCVLTPHPRPGRDDAPLYPGYLFLRLDRNEDRAPLLRMVPQMRGLVSFGGEVPSVDDEVIDAIAEQVSAINADGGLWTSPAHGAQITVTVGRTELPAQVVDHNASPRARVRVLLEFFGRQVPAELSAGSAAFAGHGPLGRILRPRVPRRTRGRRRWIQGYGLQVAEPAPVAGRAG